MIRSIAFASLFAAVARAQQVGTNTAEVHPKITTQKCTKSGGCTTQNSAIVLDSNWRWLHSTTGYSNCYTGNTWDASLCPDAVTCAKNCALDGADYGGTYGIATSGSSLTLKFVTGANIGSRVYLLAPNSDTAYQMLNLKNQEFTFDVDMSNLPCGLNGALYLSEMAADGGMSKYSGNKAGAKYGTGYCDAQCPHDLKFINGESNSVGWTPASNDPNSGKGTYGTCCPEMDIWEANQSAAAYTPHPCSVTGQTRCTGTDCGDGSNRYGGVCDKDGCDFNSYRMGDKNFFGLGKTIDTKSKITVVTQFITTDGTANGDLKEIRRIYVQNGKVYQNSYSNQPSITAANSITDNFCTQQKTSFGDTNSFSARGGLKTMGAALGRGMVLTMSIWDDHEANALWLDSSYPVAGDPSKPGIARGPCATTSGVPKDVEAQVPNSSVTFSNIKWGDLDSTYTGTPVNPTGPTTSTGQTTSTSLGKSTTSSKPTTTTSIKTTATPTPTGTGAPRWGQCGGKGWTGPTSCESPWKCTPAGEYYSQCL